MGRLVKLKELGEFNLIEHIRRRAKSGGDIHRGIGDDAAVVTIPNGHSLLTSTDMLIEGIHFRLDWTSPEDLGHKAVAVNLSDIAAMGGSPRFLYLAMACPGDSDLENISAFIEGALAEAEKYDVALVGGDTCQSPGPWIISVTIEGSIPTGKDVGRDGARPGDIVMMTGALGDSALALALYMLEKPEAVQPALANRHHRPTARVKFGDELGKQQLASALIDISDGLAGDLEHILQASMRDAVIFEEKLPRSEAYQSMATSVPGLLEKTFFGGEDYELLFTVAPENVHKVVALGTKLHVPVTEIGVIKEGSGVLSLHDRTGSTRPIHVRGYDHFCRP